MVHMALAADCTAHLLTWSQWSFMKLTTTQGLTCTLHYGIWSLSMTLLHVVQIQSSGVQKSTLVGLHSSLCHQQLSWLCWCERVGIVTPPWRREFWTKHPSNLHADQMAGHLMAWCKSLITDVKTSLANEVASWGKVLSVTVLKQSNRWATFSCMGAVTVVYITFPRNASILRQRNWFSVHKMEKQAPSD